MTGAPALARGGLCSVECGGLRSQWLLHNYVTIRIRSTRHSAHQTSAHTYHLSAPAAAINVEDRERNQISEQQPPAAGAAWSGARVSSCILTILPLDTADARLRAVAQYTNSDLRLPCPAARLRYPHALLSPPSPRPPTFTTKVCDESVHQRPLPLHIPLMPRRHPLACRRAAPRTALPRPRLRCWALAGSGSMCRPPGGHRGHT